MTQTAQLLAMPFMRKLEAFAEATENFSLQALKGRLCELSGQAALSMAMGLVREAQERNEPVVWITDDQHAFFPPDVVANGIDLDALVLAFLPDAAKKSRAADQFIRSGAFGLAVIDLGTETRVTPALISRLMGLAQKHETVVVFLTTHDVALGSLISLRAETKRTRRAHGEFVCQVRAIKDKRRAPGWTQDEVCRGPTGLY